MEIIEGLVPNQCNLVSLHTRKRPNLLNSLPAYLRNLTDIPTQKFKKELDRSQMNLVYPNTQNIEMPHQIHWWTKSSTT